MKAFDAGEKIPTKPNGKSTVSNARTTKSTSRNDASATAPTKSHGKSPALQEAILTKGHVNTSVSSAIPAKPSMSKGVSSANGSDVMFFRDLSFGPHEAVLMFRLIHFWEAKNPLTRTLIGLGMLLMDEQGTVIQGFIPPGRIETYLPHMRPGTVYKLNNFFGSRNKTLYRVAEHSVTVTFSWNSVLSELQATTVSFPEDRFRFHGHKEFEKNCELKGDLYDYIGHLKLVNGQTIVDGPILDEEEIASTQRVLLHVQRHDEPVIKVYLWDKAATEFCHKFKSYGNTPSVVLVTTVNPKRYGGTLSLASMSSSRVFMDTDAKPTKDYLSWLGNSEIANKINADAVTKLETMTIGELFSYIKQDDKKVAWFECTATIDDVVHGSGWYYIACGGCNTKATKGSTSLMCKKCGKDEVVGVAEYLTKLSVYDNNEQAVFVLLGDAGRQLTGRHASDLVQSYFEANDSVGVDHIVPVPQALIETIGQTHKFVVKISEHNLTGKTQTITVTKVLSPKDAGPVGDSEEKINAPAAEGHLGMGNAESDSSKCLVESGNEMLKRVSEGDETEAAKRIKCGQ